MQWLSFKTTDYKGVSLSDKHNITGNNSVIKDLSVYVVHNLAFSDQHFNNHGQVQGDGTKQHILIMWVKSTQ